MIILFTLTYLAAAIVVFEEPVTSQMYLFIPYQLPVVPQNAVWLDTSSFLRDLVFL